MISRDLLTYLMFLNTDRPIVDVSEFNIYMTIDEATNIIRDHGLSSKVMQICALSSLCHLVQPCLNHEIISSRPRPLPLPHLHEMFSPLWSA